MKRVVRTQSPPRNAHADGTVGRPTGKVTPVRLNVNLTQVLGDKVKARAAEVGVEPTEYVRMALLQALGEVTIKEASNAE